MGRLLDDPAVFKRHAEAMLEKDLQECVRLACRVRRLPIYHTWDSRRSEPGFPDCVIVLPAEVIFAELKTQKGRVSTDQRRWLNDLHGARARCYLWRPSHWLSDSIQKVLDGGDDPTARWSPQ